MQRQRSAIIFSITVGYIGRYDCTSHEVTIYIHMHIPITYNISTYHTAVRWKTFTSTPNAEKKIIKTNAYSRPDTGIYTYNITRCYNIILYRGYSHSTVVRSFLGRILLTPICMRVRIYAHAVHHVGCLKVITEPITAYIILCVVIRCTSRALCGQVSCDRRRTAL